MRAWSWERRVPFPHQRLRVMTQCNCEPLFIFHIWWEIEPGTLSSRDSCENQSALWASLRNMLCLLLLSPCLKSIQGADSHIKIIHIQFQYHQNTAIFRFDSLSCAEIVSREFCKLLNVFIKRFYSYRETPPYKTKVRAELIQWFCLFDGEKLLCVRTNTHLVSNFSQWQMCHSKRHFLLLWQIVPGLKFNLMCQKW